MPAPITPIAEHKITLDFSQGYAASLLTSSPLPAQTSHVLHSMQTQSYDCTARIRSGTVMLRQLKCPLRPHIVHDTIFSGFPSRFLSVPLQKEHQGSGTTRVD